MSDHDRDYDVVLWGATGFTGRLVADYLAERYGASDLDWALAGRDERRLGEVRDELAADHGGEDDGDDDLASLDLLVGDAFDRESLDAVAERTAVVCTTVGPYARYGSELVAACVDAGTDYCDLSGEVQWMRRMIDRHHEAARERGVRIVHACGFDSVPSDLGTLLLQTHAVEEAGAPCDEVRGLVSVRGGSFSGGTLASMIESYEAGEDDPDARRALADPYSLHPAGERAGPSSGPQRGLRYDDTADTWTAPFVMAQINEPVVRRSNALLGYPWERTFRYSEAMRTGDGLSGAAWAAGFTAGLGLFGAAMAVRPVRELLAEYVLPDPGEGPDRDTIEGSSFETLLVGTGVSDDRPEGFTIEATVRGDRDPGYGCASRMLAESAVCLARDEVDSPRDGGVLTPASGIGLPLIDRLEGTGISFDVEVRQASGDR